MSRHASDELLEFGAFPAQRVKPFAALKAAIRLLRDSQDTKQVALLQMALGGYSNAQVFERFVKSETGRNVILQRRSLVELLDDHAYLRSLPENSLGRHYLIHMEQAGFTVQGLLDATPAVTAFLAEQAEAVRIFLDYTVRGAHDVHHILGGYGRDELGEACVLAMVSEHTKIRGYKPIIFVAPFVVRKHLRRLKVDGSGVFAAVLEAKRIGRQAAWLPGLDIAAILSEDLETLQAKLNIQKPVIYNEIISRLRRSSAWQSGPLVRIPHEAGVSISSRALPGPNSVP